VERLLTGYDFAVDCLSAGVRKCDSGGGRGRLNVRCCSGITLDALVLDLAEIGERSLVNE